MRYKRVLLKLTGAALAGTDKNSTFNQAAIDHITTEVMSLVEIGVQVAMVVGGGNIFRGNLASQWQIEQAEADNMGMLGTIINGVLMRAVLESKGVNVRLTTALPIPSVAEPYIRLRAVRHLEKGRVVILSGGMGQPYVTTDYPAVQRAVETRCEAVLVAKHGVDGIYNADPKKDEGARRYATLSSEDVLRGDLRAMDQQSLILARDHNLPVHVFNFDTRGIARRLCLGEDVGTLVTSGVVSTLA